MNLHDIQTTDDQLMTFLRQRFNSMEWHLDEAGAYCWHYRISFPDVHHPLTVPAENTFRREAGLAR